MSKTSLFTWCTSQLMHKITNLWTFELNRSSPRNLKLFEIDFSFNRKAHRFYSAITITTPRDKSFHLDFCKFWGKIAHGVHKQQYCLFQLQQRSFIKIFLYMTRIRSLGTKKTPHSTQSFKEGFKVFSHEDTITWCTLQAERNTLVALATFTPGESSPRTIIWYARNFGLLVRLVS